MPAYEIVIIGGGIVGLATAAQLLTRRPRWSICVLEKEPRLGVHQTGRNSGVIHSGLYYRPGSLKALTCVEGARLMVEFCRRHGIPHEVCGKLIVGTQPEELPRLQTLYERGLANGVPGLSLLDGDALRRIEPNAAGLRALHVPGTAITDFTAVARTLAQLIQQRGGTLQLGAAVRHIRRRAGRWIVETVRGDLSTGFVITCGGLHADRLARMTGAARAPQIVPFRGEYHELAPRCRALVRGLIYPVPDPALPFLGVHVTRTVHGEVHVGPNAVLALKREGYGKMDVDLKDLAAMLGCPGFWKMAVRWWRVGLEETLRSLSKRRFVATVQRLVPSLRADDLIPTTSGVRAQAVDQDGRLLDDFHLEQQQGALHVRNAPSPAATASLRIGQLIADRVVAAYSG